MELLVSVLLVGLLASMALRRDREILDPDSPAAKDLCRANKRNLSAAVEALAAGRPGEDPPRLPTAYPELVAAGLLRAVPWEPGTRDWPYTYGSDVHGHVWCRVHDLGERSPPGVEEKRERMFSLELLAFALILTTAAAHRVVERRFGRRPSAPIGLARMRTLLPGVIRAREDEARVAAEVREFLEVCGPVGTRRRPG